jgi:hypothetical protein
MSQAAATALEDKQTCMIKKQLSAKPFLKTLKKLLDLSSLKML